MPVIEIGQLMERLLLDVEAPIADLMHISADPAENLPVVGLLRIDDDGDLPLPGHETASKEVAKLISFILPCEKDFVNDSVSRPSARGSSPLGRRADRSRGFGGPRG